MIRFFIASFLIFALLLGWVAVQYLYRAFSQRHPELGPAREEGLGCGLFCGCFKQGNCPKANLSKSLPLGGNTTSHHHSKDKVTL
jgi:hypothetical protein